MYHFIPDLLSSSEKPKNLQLYFYDNESELANRMAYSAHISESTVKKLMTILSKNPYSIFIKSLMNIPTISDFCIALKCHSGFRSSAGIWLEHDSTEVNSGPHIRIYTHNKKMMKMEYCIAIYYKELLTFRVGEARLPKLAKTFLRLLS
ncbi:hypothetical protein H5410_065001 [Solanum commersonii]|uniref:Uncharacterized protein n=1 Tax=Solanum commersonii TaxID=4109 RepID=A0A9J5VXS0_SOLCO|nr:hypothetical protein H5410_065001 [Solanum commersonii]